MARRRGSGNLRYGLMAVAISMVLWGIAHGERRAERNVDIPVAFDGLPDDVVITEQSTSEINIRVQGSRAALRNVSPTTMEYPVAVEGAFLLKTELLRGEIGAGCCEVLLPDGS